MFRGDFLYNVIPNVVINILFPSLNEQTTLPKEQKNYSYDLEFFTMAQVLGADDDDEDFSSVAKHAVLSDSAPVDERVTEIHGLNWDKGIPDVVTLMDSFIASGEWFVLSTNDSA